MATPKNLDVLKQHAFKPGVSGNPGGRPKRLPVTDVIIDLLNQPCKADKEGRKWSELIVTALMQRAVKGDVKAIAELIDRAEGKPKQRIENTGADGAPLIPIPETREDLERRIAEILGTNQKADTTKKRKR